VALSVAVALWVQKIVIEKQGVALTLDTMRTAIAGAESVRAGMSQLGERGAFDRQKLLAEYRASGDLRRSTLYRTIPIVATWEAIERAAKEQGFEFRIPKNQARNPKNNPQPAEREILDVLEKQGLPEYVKVDRSANTVIYARPIKLTADCLHCHGDPANSPTHDGKDIVGLPMENWKTGEVHGQTS
jgi:methyl-accepting chemotaxis protein